MTVSKKATVNVLLLCLTALAIFHIMVLFGVISDEMVWGGRAVGVKGNLVVLESVALAVTFLFAAIVAARAGYFGFVWNGKLIFIAMWFVFGYFTVGIFANLMSSSFYEQVIFTPINVVLAVLSLRVAMSK